MKAFQAQNFMAFVAIMLFLALALNAIALEVNWVVHSDLTPKDDYAEGVCEYGDYIYVVGSDFSPGHLQIRVEKRAKADGSLVEVFTYDPTDWNMLYSCLVVGGKIYAVGRDSPRYDEWLIIVLDSNLKLIQQATSDPSEEGDDEATDIASDGNYLYIVGYVRKGLWRVEKRRISDLKLVKVRSVDLTPGLDSSAGVGVNPATEQVWVVGKRGTCPNCSWRVEILDRDLNLIKAVEFGIGEARTVSFDEQGNAYVAGDGGIVKFDKHGNVLAKNMGVGGSGNRAIYARGYVYLYANTHIEGLTKQTVFVLDKSLRLVERAVLSERDTNMYIGLGSIASDVENLYLVGFSETLRDPEWNITYLGWNIYSVRLKRPMPPVVKLSPAKMAWMNLAEMGVDSDGDGLREVVFSIDVPSSHNNAEILVVVECIGSFEVSASLRSPTGDPIRGEEHGWGWAFKLSSARPGVYELNVEEESRNHAEELRVYTISYRIEDGIIAVPGPDNLGAPAMRECRDWYSIIDENGYSPALLKVEPQTVEVDPGEVFGVEVRYRVHELSYARGTRLQLFLVYSWSPKWPPETGHYYVLFDGVPPRWPGTTDAKIVELKAPNESGIYYIWFCVGRHRGMEQAIQQVVEQPTLPAHVRVVVRKATQIITSSSIKPSEAPVETVQSTSPTSPAGTQNGVNVAITLLVLLLVVIALMALRRKKYRGLRSIE